MAAMVTNDFMWRREEFRQHEGATTTVGFTGDLLLDYPPGQSVEIQPELLEKMRECDFVVVNQEGPLTTAPMNKTKLGVVLSAPPACANRLADMNIRLANLGNNHMMDHNREGLAQTLEVLHRQGIMTFGAGLTEAEASRPCIVDLPFGKLAMLAYCTKYWGSMASKDGPGPVPMDLPKVKSLIASLRQAGHIVCVQYHGGGEHIRIPCPERREMFHELARNGAHMVIGHHAHVFQGMEVLDGSVIAYGLGNFYLNLASQRAYSGTDVGLLMALEMDAQGPFAVRYLFTKIGRDNATLSTLEGPESERALRIFEEISAISRDDRASIRWWRYECLLVATGRRRISPPRFPGVLGRAIRLLRSLFLYCKGALRSGKEREIVLAAIQALPMLFIRRRANRRFAEIKDILRQRRR